MTSINVFLSSTSKDLHAYRDAAYAGIEGAVPFHCVRMEDFSSNDKTAERVCREKIEECDLFVCIVGLCYGSVPSDSEISYTRQEYDIAKALPIPILAFISEENAFYDGYYRESDDLWQKQQQFRSLVSNERTIKTFRSPDELKAKIIQAVNDWNRNNDIITKPGFFEDRSTSSMTFDHTFVEGVSLADLDLKQVEEFYEKERVIRQDDFLDASSIQEQLEKMGLLIKSEPTNAALLCFGRNPQNWIPGSSSCCIYWLGNGREQKWEERQDIKGSILTQYKRILTFLRRNLHLGRDIHKDRQEEYEIPLGAVQEVIANALVHREYSNRHEEIQIELFNDRIEIKSPGNLPSPMRIELLGKEEASHPRNPQIARLFYLAGYIERVGTGIQRMQKILKKANLNKASFELSAAETFKVIVLRPAIHTSDTEYHKLRKQYLQRIFDRSRFLPLRTVDYKTANAETTRGDRLKLSDIYIDLDTTHIEMEIVEDAMEGKNAKSIKSFKQFKYKTWTALDAMINNSHLVLVGDPGGGKTTFLNHLALCLAGDALDPNANWIYRLRNWPDDRKKMLPVPIVLRELAAWFIKIKPFQRGVGMFNEYIEFWLKNVGLGDFYRSLGVLMKEGKAILLIDGLDEVTEQKDVMDRLKEMIHDLPAAFPTLPIVVTCRVLSYQDPAWQLDKKNWIDFELESLDEKKINRFINAWYQQLADMNVISNPKASSAKLIRAVQRPDLWRLARNPLLLTVMALVHTYKGEMPDARALLYEDVVDLLLWRWEAIKLEFDNSKETTWRKLLQKADLQDIDLKQALWELAYATHGQMVNSNSHEATANIPEATLHSSLRKLHPNRSLDWADQLLQIMKLRAGLLLEREPGIYSFPHRTFEEYLAGCHLTTLDFTAKSVQLAGQGLFWRELILLAVGRLVHLNGDIDKPLVLVNELCPIEKPDSKDTAGWRNVWLAGQCLREIGMKRAERRKLGPELKKRVQGRLTHLITRDLLEPRERAEAGTVLSVIGDPRDFDEMLSIPEGKFLMGSKKEEIHFEVEKEIPQHTVSLPAYRISKYPITNGQYAVFIDATGHNPPEFWKNSSPPSENINHPVIEVSWHDAQNYCQWLSKMRGETVRLPTEAEWEKAARCEDGRIYPWGETLNSNYCNVKDTGIKKTSSVGIFRKGVSPYGCFDMAGNVWEWTQSQYKDYPYRTDDGREEISENDDRDRVLRGGSFDLDGDNARCAFRSTREPEFRLFGFGFRVVSPGLCFMASEKI